MRELVLARRTGIVAVAAACGALIAAPALADVAVSPAVATQGGGADFNFHVTNTGTAPIGTVKLTLPADAPIAEAYPLSTDDWAPKITTRTLSEALPTAHTGIPTTQVTAAITWIAMPGLALKPGQSADLKISAAPLPTLSSMKFTVTTTYTDGKAGPPMSALNVTLSQPTDAEVAAEHAGHDGTAAGTDDTSATDPNTPAEDAAFAKVVADATRGPSVASIAGWLLAAVVLLGGGAWLMLRGRHRAEEDDEPEDEELTKTADEQASAPSAAEGTTAARDDAKQPVVAGKWSLKE